METPELVTLNTPSFEPHNHSHGSESHTDSSKDHHASCEEVKQGNREDVVGELMFFLGLGKMYCYLVGDGFLNMFYFHPDPLKDGLKPPPRFCINVYIHVYIHILWPHS